MLKKITLLRERVEHWNVYHFSVPAIASLPEISLDSRIVFFAGENGTGKSTLVEAIAAHYGFGREGGNRNFSLESTDTLRAIDPLVKALRVSFSIRTGAGFYLRAESFFNVATFVDSAGMSGSYGGKSLPEQAHREVFLSVRQHRFSRSCFFVLGGPAGSLSPQRRLTVLIL